MKYISGHYFFGKDVHPKGTMYIHVLYPWHSLTLGTMASLLFVLLCSVNPSWASACFRCTPIRHVECFQIQHVGCHVFEPWIERNHHLQSSTLKHIISWYIYIYCSHTITFPLEFQMLHVQGSLSGLGARSPSEPTSPQHNVTITMLCCNAGSVCTTLQHSTTFVVDLLLDFEAVFDIVGFELWQYLDYKAWSQLWLWGAVKAKKLATFFCHAAGRPCNHTWEVKSLIWKKWHKTEYHLLTTPMNNFQAQWLKLLSCAILVVVPSTKMVKCHLYPSLPFRRMFELRQGLIQTNKRDWRLILRGMLFFMAHLWCTGKMPT